MKFFKSALFGKKNTIEYDEKKDIYIYKPRKGSPIEVSPIHWGTSEEGPILNDTTRLRALESIKKYHYKNFPNEPIAKIKPHNQELLDYFNK
jgi:hypothetical protein